jgi:hypothetical protein
MPRERWAIFAFPLRWDDGQWEMTDGDNLDVVAVPPPHETSSSVEHRRLRRRIP